MSEPCPPNCDWPENRKYLQETLKDMRSDMKDWRDKQEQRDAEIYKRLTSLQVAEGQLRIKSGAWGAIGAAVVAAAAFFWEKLKGG